MLKPSKLKNQTLAWLEQCQRDGEQGLAYVFSGAASEPTLMAFCFAILTAELYDALDPNQNSRWRRMLLAAQDPATGLFGDPVFSPQDLEPTSLGEGYLRHQINYFALNALDALGGKPEYPLEYAKPYLSIPYLREWLEGLEWSHPWRESNLVMFIATALYVTWQWQGERGALSALHGLLDWLDEHQDPETGFWGVAEGASLHDAMAGAYHFLPYYLSVGRPLHFPEKMIESTLSLQQPDGLFHPEGGGDTCLDVDAVDILVKCGLLSSHLAPQVLEALERAYEGILDNWCEDGGFCRALHRPLPEKSWKRRLGEAVGLDRLLGKPYRPTPEVWNYSGWTKLPFDIRQGDLWSTWFRSFGLAVIGARYPDRFPTDVHWRFRRIPALGWHDPACIAQSRSAVPCRAEPIHSA